MAIALMTWVESTKRWTKKFQGKMHAVSCKQLGTKATEEASRTAANEWWIARENSLAADPVRDTAAAELDTMADWLNGAGRTGEAAELKGRASDLRAMEPGSVSTVEIPSRSLPQASRAVWADRLANVSRTPSIQTIGAAWSRWFDSMILSCNAEQFTPSRLESYRSASNRFVDWAGRGNPVTALDSAKLFDYREYLLGLVTAEAVVRKGSAMGRKAKLTSITADGYLSTAKQFVSWLVERDIIELPKALLSKKLRIKKTVAAPKPAAVAVVKQLLSGCDGVAEKTKLYLLLMLNCGMYQTDVAELKNEAVNWKAGTITRPRSKTPGGPVVTYYLWPATLELLRKYRQPGELVLLNEKGGPLLRDSFKKAYAKICNITTAYKRLAKRLGGGMPTLKQLRKTSATVLGAHPAFKFYAQYFLAQSPRTVADKHYVVPNEVEFAAACKWLGEQYGC